MKAVLEHDDLTRTVQFRVSKQRFSIIYGVPPRLTEIKEISDYDKGFITMQTNYGEEYTDLIETVNREIFPKSYRTKATHILENLTLEDITLKRS